MAALLSVGLPLGCSAPVRVYDCPVAVRPPTVDVDDVWSCHRDIVKRAARGKKFTLREFREAAAFFERVTGIPADARQTPHGLLPGKNLRASLKAWDNWYAGHRDELVRSPMVLSTP